MIAFVAPPARLQTFLLYEWSTSQSVGITMETVLGYTER